MSNTAIIQARLGSTRLPGKSLKLIHGKTMLDRVIDRVLRSHKVDSIVVATTKNPIDDELVQLVEKRNIECFRGSEDDVLDRFYQAVKSKSLQTVVRITSDCPLIDPGVIDATIQAYLDTQNCDYASNVHPRTFPRGLDVEVMSAAVLGRISKIANKEYERAHVTPYIYEHPNEFKITNYTHSEDVSAYRWTVDVQEDLDFVTSIYKYFDGRDHFSFQEVIKLLKEKPDLQEVNSRISQKALKEG